ncbi:hypothetical protein DPQ33_09190 [Oceanidesulfovibrio indonesiensis]|uniref:Flagellar brake protein n=1 Tax=Oceanidesulfovibrio indonesiensis TaxID=54767 RepID=A0A7M3MFE2_9BACT|nr:flagellar brake protein [Oceanidesulfovibrio indonesiensis]TVM17347.1 hypothetical protein DPQ33_09190 [Oceanidesulfovibrio indonesiensis]
MGWDKMDLPIGHEMLVQFEGEKARFKSAYYGQKPEEFLIIQMPGIPGIREKLLNGSGLVIRYFVSGRVYGFKAHSMGHVVRPCPLIFLSYPHSVESLNLRQNERVNTFLDAQGTIDDVTMQGVILDLSAGGCMLMVNRSTGVSWPNLDPGQIIHLEFALGKNEEPLRILSQTISARKDPERIRLGIKFILNTEKEADAAAVKKLEKYIGTISGFLRGEF